MSSDGELEPFSDAVDELFARLGLPDPILNAKLLEEWDQLAGAPWAGRAKPLMVSGKTLVVEASAPSMIAFLRYSETDLLATLEKRFGKGVIDAIEVVPPRSR